MLLNLIWPQKGTKSTKLKNKTLNFNELQWIKIEILTFYEFIKF